MVKRGKGRGAYHPRLDDIDPTEWSDEWGRMPERMTAEDWRRENEDPDSYRTLGLEPMGRLR